MSLRKWLITLAACAIVFALLAWYKVTEIRTSIEEAAAYPEQSETVEEALVETTTFQPTITLLGEIVAPQRLDLRNEFAGEITAVNFESGARVEQGQLLLQLDTSLEEAQLGAARAQEELARLSFDRNQRLLESGATNQETLDRARADLATTRSTIAVLERTIDRKTLRAPFSGFAGLHTFEVGQYLSENTVITTLIGDTGDLWVDFQVPQFYPALQTGAEVWLRPVGSTGGHSISARVIAGNTVLDAANRSRSYRARLPAGAGLAPQAMVQVAAPVDEAETLLRVPSLAVQNDPLGQYVYLLSPNEGGQGYRAHRQQVAVRVIEGDSALLEPGRGLQEGQRVAAAGAFKLYEGILTHVGQREGASPPVSMPEGDGPTSDSVFPSGGVN